MKVNLSPLVASLSGTAADAVAASWKGRQYVRRRVTPANPNSAAQQTVRNSLGRLPRLWRSLSAAVKAVQDTYASPYLMSGYNWFVKNNRLLEETHASDQLTPPNTTIDPVQGLTLADQTGGSCQIDWTGGTQGANYSVSVWKRIVEDGSEDTEFTLVEDATTLVSAGTLTTAIGASNDYRIIVAVEDTTNDYYSTCVSDVVTMGA